MIFLLSMTLHPATTYGWHGLSEHVAGAQHLAMRSREGAGRVIPRARLCGIIRKKLIARATPFRRVTSISGEKSCAGLAQERRDSRTLSEIGQRAAASCGG